MLLDCWFMLSWLFRCLGWLIARICFIKGILREDAIKGSNLANSLCGFEAFNFRLVLVYDNHGLDFVNLMQVSNFALN